MIIRSGWYHKDAFFVCDFTFKSGHSVPIFHVNSIHALNQLVGYSKYLNRFEGNIFFRGQTKIYNTMTPSLLRDVKTIPSLEKSKKAIVEYIKLCNMHIRLFSSEVKDYVKEPLLQHYGIKTRWLDLVDNLWIALFFGLFNIDVTVFGNTIYNHLVSRNINPFCQIDYKDKHCSDNQYQYIFLLLSDGKKDEEIAPGLYIGNQTTSIDLRKSASSIFLRPHNQHAILIKSTRLDDITHIDLSNQIVGIIRLFCHDALYWLGNGKLVMPENMYPSFFNDQGYQILVEQAPNLKKYRYKLGTITMNSFSTPNI